MGPHGWIPSMHGIQFASKWVLVQCNGQNLVPLNGFRAWIAFTWLQCQSLSRTWTVSLDGFQACMAFVLSIHDALGRTWMVPLDGFQACGPLDWLQHEQLGLTWSP